MGVANTTKKEGTKHSNENEDSNDSDYSEKGLRRKKNGTWWVQIGWRNFKVTTAEGIDSMERAVNLHDALTQVRNLAMARYNSAVSELKELDCLGGRHKTSDLDTCPVMI